MKQGSHHGIPALVFAAVLTGLWAPALAEVATDPLPRLRARTMLLDFTFTSITDGADPIPTLSWRTYRSLPPGRQLNRGGALRPDGRPDVIYRSLTAAPLVVWAYNNGGGEHDIAFAAWENNNWGPTHFLTSTVGVNELDPRVFQSPSGAVYVVWSAQAVTGVADSRIMLATWVPGAPLENGDAELLPVWSEPVRVSPPGEIVARPTVAASHGFLWIAHERIPENDFTTPSQIIVRRRSLTESVGGYDEVKVLTTERLGLLNPLLTAAHGRLWLDWQHADGHFGFTRLRSADLDWMPPQTVPWPNHSWQGIEDVRQTIRRLMQSPSSSVDPAGTPQ